MPTNLLTFFLPPVPAFDLVAAIACTWRMDFPLATDLVTIALAKISFL
jgi:hypothetical protein